MINAPATNVSLTDAETAKIELVKNRLSVLQNEVLDATKQLASLEMLIVSAQKSKEYAEVQLKETECVLVSTKEELASVTNTLHNEKVEIAKHREQYADLQSKMEVFHKNHADKTEEINKKEAEHTHKHTALSEKENKIAEREIKIEKASAAFRKALESVTW